MSKRVSHGLADAEARETIARRLDLNILVEAGAGSGKTHSLARRMAAGIVSGRYVVGEMAAVTFTRKAAAELRGRFQLALERSLDGAAPEERARIETALAEIEHLFAGTIHSFCARLLRERPVEAGVAPGFTELDEVEDAESRQRAWREYLSRLRAAGSPLLEELQRAGVKAADLDGALAVICTFDEVEFPSGSAPAPDTAAAKKAADALWKKLKPLMPATEPPDAKCAALRKAQIFRARIRAAGSGRPADIIAALKVWETVPKVTMKWWAEGREEGRKLRDTLEALVGAFAVDTVEPALRAWRHYVYGLAMTLLSEARESARGERRRDLALNYGDLLVGAARLLRGNAAVRAALQRKYRWLFVDEFQDTDPIQAEVMLLLAADEQSARVAAGAPIDPFSLPLRPGALFVVGDPKQSIYRFRRADIDTYNRVRRIIEETGGRVVALTTSFRARPSLSEWNNEVFADVFPAEATPQQAAFERLDSDPAWKARRLTAAGELGLRILEIPADCAAGEVPAWEAGAIARYIRAKVDAGRAAFEDFLILTRKKKHLAVYAAALGAIEIPHEVSGAGAFGDSPLVEALIGLLRVLGDPADTVGVVGVLRGPLFGLSDAQLFEHRQGGGHIGLAHGRERAGTDGAASPVEEALGRLADWLGLTRTLPLSAALERMLEDSGLLALGATGGSGGAQAGDLLHAVGLVRGVAAEGGSVADAAALLEEAAKSPEVESVPLEPGRRDVVRLMNLHKAKGLEAPVVFLADPAGGVRGGVNVRIVREGAAARGYLSMRRELNEYRSEAIAEPENWDDHETEEQAYLAAEELRLLYVAATRARELLVVSQWARESKGKRPWGLLDDHLDDAPELEVPKPGKAAPSRREAISLAARVRAAGARVRRHQAARQATWDVTAVTRAIGQGRGTGDEGRGTGDKAKSATRGDEAAAGARWGSLVHGLLEHAMRRPGATRADLERLAGWLTLEAPELRPAIPAALDLLERTVGSRFWQDAVAGGKVSVEVPFAVRIQPGETFAGLPPATVPTVLHGVIDLLYRGADGWRILDYKTDLAAAEGEALLAHHAPQLAMYREAFERVAGQRVTGRGIVALRTGNVEWVE